MAPFGEWISTSCGRTASGTWSATPLIESAGARVQRSRRRGRPELRRTGRPPWQPASRPPARRELCLRSPHRPRPGGRAATSRPTSIDCPLASRRTTRTTGAGWELTAPTLDKLQSLKLDAMAHAWTEQHHHAELTSLAFDERFGLLVEAEWLARDNKRVTRALKEAKLKLPHACLEAIDYPARRELDKAVIRQLATCRWVQEHQNVILVGATGTGKSFVACALAAHACRKGFRAYYRRAPAALSRPHPGPRRRHLRPPARQARPRRRPASSTTGGSRRSRTRSAATCSRSSRTATATAPPSSPASSRRPSGTTTSPTPPWPTPSATASSTTPIDSC